MDKMMILSESTISINDVEVSRYVDMHVPIRFESGKSHVELDVLTPLLSGFALRMSSGKLDPIGYHILFHRTHPRIRRMHHAYRRRHGKGKW